MPFIGYLLVFNSELTRYLELVEFIESNDLEILDRLVSTYYGLVLVGLASLSFSLACPAVIKQNANRTSFIRDEIQHITLARLQSLFEEATQKMSGNNVYAFEFGQAVEAFVGSKNERVFVPRDPKYQSFHQIGSTMKEPSDAAFLIVTAKEKRDDICSHALHKVWIAEDASSPFFRAFIFAIYMCGVYFISRPSIEVFIKVVSAE